MAEDKNINSATPKVNLSGNEEYPANDSGSDRKVNTDSISNYSISKLFSNTSQGSLADNDKFSINGTATVLWSVIKSYMEMFSNKVNLFSASTETPSGVPTIQQTANEEFTANIKALQTEISRIATASGTVYADLTPVSITTTESELDISIQSDSNNTDIIEFDATLNRITLKRFGRYQFYTNIELRNTSLAAEHTLTIRTRNATGGAIITERTVTVSKNIIKSDSALVQIDVPEGSEPITLYISVQSDDNTSLSLESLVTTLSAAGVQGLDNDVNVKITANDTTTGYLNDKLVVGGEFTKEVVSPSGNETLLLKLTGWFYNAARTFKAIFNFESLTSDRTITWQDKSITVAGLDDIVVSSDTEPTTTREDMLWFDTSE